MSSLDGSTSNQSASFYTLLGQLSQGISLLGQMHAKELEEARRTWTSQCQSAQQVIEKSSSPELRKGPHSEPSPWHPVCGPPDDIGQPSQDEDGVGNDNVELQGVELPHLHQSAPLVFEEDSGTVQHVALETIADVRATLHQDSGTAQPAAVETTADVGATEDSLRFLPPPDVPSAQHIRRKKTFSNAVRSALKIPARATSKDSDLLDGANSNPFESEGTRSMSRQTSPESPHTVWNPNQLITGRSQKHTCSDILEVDFHQSRTGRFQRTKESVNFTQNQFLIKFCESIVFQACVATAIFLNTAFMSYEADTTMEARLRGESGSNTLIFWIDLIFCIVFAMELILKLLAYRLMFFFGAHKAWNIFDLAIVATAVNDQIQVLVSSGRGTSLVYLRVLRAFKLVRVLRIVKMLRFFRHLRVIATNMIHALSSLTWSMLLIALVTFVFGLAFMNAWGQFLDANDVSPELQAEIEERWGSTRAAMLTLYMSSTGGINWGPASEPLWQVHPIYFWLFLLYVSFFLFVVANCITALIVDQGLQASSQVDADQVELALAKKAKYLEIVQDLFDSMEKDEQGNVSVEEFSSHLTDDSMVAFCVDMDIQPSELDYFFSQMSGGGKRSVDLDTFVVGCIKLRGRARSADLVSLAIEVREFQQSQAIFKAFCKAELIAIHNDVRALATEGVTSTGQQQERVSL